MSVDDLNLKLVLMLTIGFSLASFFGYLAHRIKLSPILGYLTAGYLIGPYSPGYHADLDLSEQLAEIGVILMMFGVGLHFKWEDLANVKKIAIPGAIGQTLIATLAVVLIVHAWGWTIEQGIIYGLAIGVASTVVLVRVLTDNQLLKAKEGHVAVGWLIVEDMITVLALLLIPTLASSLQGEEFSVKEMSLAFISILIKFILLAVFMFTMGRKIILYVFTKILKTQSHELFTLSILAVTFIIATVSAFLFDLSIIMGAFIAGMIIGQTDIRHKVTTNTLPIKDVFAVIFFLTIGMLFDPKVLSENFYLFLIILGVVLIIKPLAAFAIVWLLKSPFSIAITIAIALAQIGEFSFILAEQATRHKLLPSNAYPIIVACAFISIALNASFFKFLHKKTMIKN